MINILESLSVLYSSCGEQQLQQGLRNEEHLFYIRRANVSLSARGSQVGICHSLESAAMCSDAKAQTFILTSGSAKTVKLLLKYKFLKTWSVIWRVRNESSSSVRWRIRSGVLWHIWGESNWRLNVSMCKWWKQVECLEKVRSWSLQQVWDAANTS